MFEKTTFEAIQEHVEKNKDFFQIGAEAIFDGTGYEYRNESDAPLFGTRLGPDYELSAFYHEYAHAIDIINQAPDRLLKPYFGMQYTTNVEIMGDEHRVPTTYNALSRECRVAAIQSKLYANVTNQNEQEVLQATCDNMAKGFMLMDDAILIPTPDGMEDFNEKDKYRLEFVKNLIKEHHQELDWDNIVDNTYHVGDIRNYRNWPTEKLEEYAHHTVRLDDLALYVMDNPWPEMSGRDVEQDVQHCLDNGGEALVETKPWYALQTQQEQEQNAENHIRKIAYFVKNPPKQPIEVDTGIPGLAEPNHIVSDGNHRLMGSKIKGRKTINANISGDVNYIQQMGLYGPNPFMEELDRREASLDNTIKKQSKSRLTP